MRTFGEFFDAVAAAVKAERIGYADVHMREWSEIDSGIPWVDARAMEFTNGLFLAFAEDMDTMFRELLGGTSGDGAYADRLEAGRKFQRVIARVGREFGLSDEVCAGADVPLTPSDAIARAQQE